jgi:hypothetical protein
MTRDDLELLFKNGAPVRGVDKETIIGKGLFESDLLGNGFEKWELKRLVKTGLLEKVTTRFQNSWRNTYVLREKKV